MPPNITAKSFVQSFFTFSWGVHLTEGSTSRTYYNADLTFCAQECIKSAGGLPTANAANASSPAGTVKVRCLSFDFYPFENPIGNLPLVESFQRGICTLNSNNRDTARLRNEDEGFTNAEWYYYSHFTKRPFSPLSGYYEVRDPRGGAIANFLQYAGNPLTGLESVNHVWGQSRWGIFHYALPPVQTNKLDCTLAENKNQNDLVNPGGAASLTYSGGFCPVSDDQHCPGLVTKLQATALCQNAGGRLCNDIAEASNIAGAKTGCSFDGWPVWTADAPSASPDAFPRCCADYWQPIDCVAYSQANIKLCSELKTASTCVNQGSSARLAPQWGMGNLLVQFRQTCATQFLTTGIPCRDMLMFDWQSWDVCIWCPAPGYGPSGGAGQCLPGSDFGVCAKSDPLVQESFAQRMKAGCTGTAICNLVTHKGYGFLQALLGVPTATPTPRPTPYPLPPATTLAPVACPSIAKRAACTAVQGCGWNTAAKQCRTAPTPAPVQPTASVVNPTAQPGFVPYYE